MVQELTPYPVQSSMIGMWCVMMMLTLCYIALVNSSQVQRDDSVKYMKLKSILCPGSQSNISFFP